MHLRLIALSVGALTVLLAPAAYAGEHIGTVAVVHGISTGPSAVPVDVYLNGDLILEDFEPKTITEQLDLPVGSYDVEVFAAGADPEAEDPVIAGSADLEAGANISLVAHLDSDGIPTLGVFVNDTSALDAGEARFTFRNTAEGTPSRRGVDVLVNGDIVFRQGIDNGQQGDADLPAGTISATVTAFDSPEDVIIGPTDVALDEGVNTILYLIGSAREGGAGVELLVQTISGLHEPPSGVESGTGGIKAAEQQRASGAPWAIALASIALAGAGVAGRRTALPRR